MPNPHHPKSWHCGSVFGDGPRRPLDREQRARFRFLLRIHHQGGRLTRAARDVGEALVRRLGVDGRCDPAQATLAADAGCCDRTVRRATAVMRNLGLLRWQQRLVRVGTRGFPDRAEQTSNAYELVPAIDAAAFVVDVHHSGPTMPCGGQRVRETRRESIPSVLPMPSAAEVRAAQEALARVRAAREALLRLA